MEEDRLVRLHKTLPFPFRQWTLLRIAAALSTLMMEVSALKPILTALHRNHRCTMDGFRSLRPETLPSLLRPLALVLPPTASNLAWDNQSLADLSVLHHRPVLLMALDPFIPNPPLCLRISNCHSLAQTPICQR